MKILIFSILLLWWGTSNAQSDSSITFSEIMFYPNGSNMEFIELYNTSELYSIDLSNFKIYYHTSSADIITSQNSGTLLPPLSYAVIFEGDYDFDSGVYNPLLPLQALILKINNGAFGSSGMANTSNRQLVLVNADNDTLDILTYTANNSSGVSDEKILMNKNNELTNWGNSKHINGTPGALNSISPRPFDLSISSIYLNPEEPVAGTDMYIHVLVKNIGLYTANEFALTLFEDVNSDSTVQPEELINSQFYYTLLSGDSLKTEFKISDLVNKTYNLIIYIDFNSDLDMTNNLEYLVINVEPEPAEFNDIVINELMYRPLNDEPEWIEFYNRTSKQINIKDWSIKDKSTKTKLSSTDLIIEPYSYLVFSDDSSVTDYYSKPFFFRALNIPSLNNSGDELVLFDNSDRVIDSLYYKNSWAVSNNGLSLERISSDNTSNDSTNWASAKTIMRGTPGYINSVTKKEFDVMLSSIIINPLTPFEGENVLIRAVIKNIGRQMAQNVVAEYYIDFNMDSLTSHDELIYSENFASVQTGDSTTANFLFADPPIGMYNVIIIINFVLDEFTENNSSIIVFEVTEKPAEFNDVVINEIMFDPDGDEPEWIEVYNKGDKKRNLKNWSVSDRTSKSTITNKELILEPSEFIVFSDDTSIINFYDIPSNLVLFNLPSLNNTDDDLKLIDNLGNVIDSLNYKKSWSGGKSGISLERKSITSPTNDSTNWGASLDDLKATPGRINSIVPEEFDLALVRFVLSDTLAILGESITGIVTIKNIGLNVIPTSVLSIFVLVNGNTRELIYDTQIKIISPNDSVNIDFVFDTYSLGQNFLIAEIYSDLDKDHTNNIRNLNLTAVAINELPGDVVINEIMYAPISPEPEWIEIYNRSLKNINIQNYKLADNADTMLIIDYPLSIGPNEFFIFASDSGFYQTYEDLTNIITTDLPSLSNTNDQVKLLNYIDQAIDSVNYKSTWGYKVGNSLERIDTEKSSNDSTNWGICALKQGGSPGKLNSISLKNIDAAIIELFFSPTNPKLGQDVNISAAVKNSGKNSIIFSLSLFEDTDLDSISNSLVDKIENINLNSGDSTIIDFGYTLTNITQEKGYLAIAELNSDEHPGNNKFYNSVAPIFPVGSIVINEIHYNPWNNEPEWFELFNNSDHKINLQNWSVTDLLTTPKSTQLSSSRLYALPKSFTVVSKDTSINNFHTDIPSQLLIVNFSNLNNDIDGIVIKDFVGRTMDSVMYNSSISGSNGQSLERLDVSVSSDNILNWASSTDLEKSTPGRINSIVKKKYDLKLSRIIIDPPFPILNETVIPSVLIKNEGKEIAENFSVSFSLTDGQTTTHLSEITGLTLLPNDSLIVTSSSSFLLTKTMGLSVEILYQFDEMNANNADQIELSPGFDRKSIVINEFNHQPFTGESEWIEFFNTTNDTINLINWAVSDVLTSPTKNIISKDDTFIMPGEFFIVCRDSALFVNSKEIKIFETNFGTLGNTEDGIIIYDFNEAIIDSLFYNRTWNFIYGHSMERFNTENTSSDPINWSPSLNISRGTPGFINSISLTNGYEKHAAVINEIMYEPSEGNCEFIELFNNSDYDLDLGGWTIVDETNNQLRLSNSNYILHSGNFFLLSADSSILNYYSHLTEFENIKIINKPDLGFSNSGEMLLLKDIKGNIIDSLNYNPNWHNRNIINKKDISIERINPALNSNNPMNWSSSVDSKGATPAEINSIYTEQTEFESKFNIEPNPFSPDNDGFQDFTIISYKLNSETAQIRIRIFDDLGRKVRTLANNTPSGSHGNVIFDGLDDKGRPLGIGMYIILLEVFGNNSGLIETIKKVLVVARKL